MEDLSGIWGFRTFACSLWLSWQRIRLQCGRPVLDPWVGKIPWRGERLSTPVFQLGEFHGLYSPWGLKESDTTERLSLLFTFHLTALCLSYSKRTSPWRHLVDIWVGMRKTSRICKDQQKSMACGHHRSSCNLVCAGSSSFCHYPIQMYCLDFCYTSLIRRL